jgi:bifunctional non-homologous end joining protein LigD
MMTWGRRALKTPSVDDFRPMLAAERRVKPFTDPGWQYEIKFDGYRTLAGFGAGPVQLRTRRGVDCTRWYPEVAEQLATLPGGPHVIDGEACVLDDVGRSDFNRLQERARRRCWYKDCDQVTLCAFDILAHDGRDVTGLPLVERKALLEKLLAGVPKRVLLYVGDFTADAGLFEQVVLGLKLEGFVAKRKDSVYRPGERTDDWVKIKRPDWQEGRRWKA